jgi:uncharacterized RDD family membrane protein YckC
MSAQPPADGGLDGHYAGIVSRFVAFVIDVVTIAALFAIGGRVVEFVVGILLRQPVVLRDDRWAANAALALWAFVYLAYPLAVSGRTFGMGAVGLRAVRADGERLGPGRAVVRVLALPLSLALFGLGFVLIVLRADRRALHDLIAGSAVVYAWNARAARVRFLTRQ